jgi:hypothetical protein
LALLTIFGIFGDGKKKTGNEDLMRFLEGKVVAGVGFEPTTFGL